MSQSVRSKYTKGTVTVVTKVTVEGDKKGSVESDEPWKDYSQDQIEQMAKHFQSTPFFRERYLPRCSFQFVPSSIPCPQCGASIRRQCLNAIKFGSLVPFCEGHKDTGKPIKNVTLAADFCSCYGKDWVYPEIPANFEDYKSSQKDNVGLPRAGHDI